jgi:hypothetical protein
MYTPDNWVILKIVLPGEVNYKVLAGWSGGYLDGDSWRMNSGITKVEEEGDYFLFHGYSGSIYRCHKDAEALRSNIAGILTELVKHHGEKMVSQIWYEEFINEFDPDLVP